MQDSELGLLLPAAEAGERGAAERLFVALYNELHRMAQHELRRNTALTLSPTTLLHETFLKLTARDCAVFNDRAHFLAYAARAMRGLLIDYVRSRQAHKRGGGFEITTLPTDVPENDDAVQLQRVGEALEHLGSVDRRLAELVDLRFFCGFPLAEIALLLGVSERTLSRDWDKARIFLHRFLKECDTRS